MKTAKNSIIVPASRSVPGSKIKVRTADRTGNFSPITYRDSYIKDGILKFFESFGVLTGNVNASFFHYLDSTRINNCGSETGAVRLGSISINSLKKAFRHLGSG